MKSIQRRLSLGLVAVLVVVGLLLAQALLWVFEHSLREQIEVRLKDEAESLIVAMVRGPQGFQLSEQRLSAAYKRPYSGLYFRIDFADTTWRSRSLWDSELQPGDKPGLQEGLSQGPQDQQLLTYRGDYQRFGQKLVIYVAEDYTPILKSVRNVQVIGLGLGLGALLLILILQRSIVRRAFGPLENTRKQIAQLQQGQLNELDSQVPIELEPLVEQINHLLAHTEETLRRSRNALGNLGHALKTPLAVLVNLSSRSELEAHPALRKKLEEALEQIEQRLSRELNKARLAGEALPGAHFDCAAELPGLFSTLQMIHNRGLQLDWNAPAGLRLPWDREDLLELLGNLLDNACKWADSKVQLQLSQGSDGYRLVIEDDGPGINAERREDVLNRGIRLDEQVSGHGLGLGIVRDIVDAWGGDISLGESSLGGLSVCILLPSRRLAIKAK
ncbi:sensor histidine kinase [Pseudomonas segetis]|uniref:histidine kinase n=1 Tax=Pseudomonas segetis TaxID=298908 RepID=A0A239AHG2_9PSED|nr:sensor histidine kinase [Pseudomonas segetis]SNR95075.1 Signal transduction histidine kinase [Pseudomonas segetis]